MLLSTSMAPSPLSLPGVRQTLPDVATPQGGTHRRSLLQSSCTRRRWRPQSAAVNPAFSGRRIARVATSGLDASGRRSPVKRKPLAPNAQPMRAGRRGYRGVDGDPGGFRALVTDAFAFPVEGLALAA